MIKVDYKYDEFLKVQREKAIIDMIKEFNNIENKIYQQNKIDKLYIVKEKRKREIITSFGIVRFKRRIYFEKATGKYVCPFDNSVGLKKYSRLLNYDLMNLLISASKNKRLSDIRDDIKIDVSLMTISRKLRNKDIENAYFLACKNIKKIEVKDNFYGQTDETYQKLRISKHDVSKCRIRITSFYTGKHQVNSKRYELDNKRYFVQITKPKQTINGDDYAKKADNFVKENYQINDNNLNRVFSGDGALYIRNAALNLNANNVLDKFHGKEALKNTFKRSGIDNWKKLYRDTYKLFKEGEIDKLINYLNDYKSIASGLIKYFICNKIGVKNQNADWNIGTSAESDISHVISETSGYGNKAYSFSTFQNLIYLKLAKLNKIDIFKFLF